LKLKHHQVDKGLAQVTCDLYEGLDWAKYIWLKIRYYKGPFWPTCIIEMI